MSRGISLPDVHGIGKGLDPNILPEKQVIKPVITSEAKGTPQIKPRLVKVEQDQDEKLNFQYPHLLANPL